MVNCLGTNNQQYSQPIVGHLSANRFLVVGWQLTNGVLGKLSIDFSNLQISRDNKIFNFMRI